MTHGFPHPDWGAGCVHAWTKMPTGKEICHRCGKENKPVPTPPASTVDHLTIYLRQYLHTATGGRVEYYDTYVKLARATNRFLRFKCKTCLDNWNVGSELFGQDGLKIPTELTDWVEKHQHVCKEFKDNKMGGRCLSCGWPWEKHKAALPYLDVNGVWVVPGPDGIKTLLPPAYTLIPSPPPEPKLKTMKEPKGRKFRGDIP